MNRSKQSGFIGVMLVGVSMLMAVGLAGLVGNHPPRHDQKVDVCKMNGTCSVDDKADQVQVAPAAENEDK